MTKTKKQIKRQLKFHGIDTILDITKVVEVDVNKKFFYIEEYKDGEYRLTYTKNLFTGNLNDLTHIEMIRSNGE